MRIFSSSCLYIIPIVITIMLLQSKSIFSLTSRALLGKRIHRKALWRMLWGSNSSQLPIQRIYDKLETVNSSEAHKIANDPSKATSISIDDCIEDMKGISLKDIGLTRETLNRVNDNICMNICSSPCYHVAVFIIPKGKSLPLHDHPGMMVLSSIISGKLHVREFTVTSECESTSAVKSLSAKLSTDCVRDRGDAWYLSACENNIHELTALENTAVFDVLLPPYKEPQRSCTYYTISKNVGRKSSRGSREKLEIGEDVILRETDEPPGQLPYGVQYTGYRPTAN